MKHTTETILFLLIMLGCILAGIAIGKYIVPSKEKIPFSERIIACEEKGGKYNYYWNSVRDYYYEKCEVIENEIKDF